MNINTYTQKAQEAFLEAEQSANRAHHAQVEPEHLLVALLEQPDGSLPRSCGRCRSIPPRCRLAYARSSTPRRRPTGGAEPGLAPRLRAVADALDPGHRPR